MILLAEDEDALREAQASYLEQAGYAVLQVTDGQEAIDACALTVFELIILDINLPQVNGLDVLRLIRTSSDVPIMMVTARDSDEDEVKGLQHGADDYIKKPFNPHVLVSRVASVLRRTNTKTLRRGAFTLDPAKMSIMKNGKSITLTAAQFEIFYKLAEHPGVIVERQQIIDVLNKKNHIIDIYDRTIDAHIKNIRKKIEDIPSSPVILRTVYGRGYVFVEQPSV